MTFLLTSEDLVANFGKPEAGATMHPQRTVQQVNLDALSNHEFDQTVKHARLGIMLTVACRTGLGRVLA